MYAVLTHAHVTGKEIYVNQIRNGTEIAYLAKNKHFSFHAQQLMFLQTPVVLKQVFQFIRLDSF